MADPGMSSGPDSQVGDNSGMQNQNSGQPSDSKQMNTAPNGNEEAAYQGYKPGKHEGGGGGGGLPIKGIAIVVAIVVIIGIVYYLYNTYATATTPPPVITHVNNNTGFSKVSSCTNITSPGIYYLVQNVSTQITSGACITISGKNIEFIGNQGGIQGTGPYTINGIPTYGILVKNAQNVIISGVTVSRFSYGVYLQNSPFISLNNVTVRILTLSGVYVKDSSNTTLKNDNITQVSSAEGGVSVHGSSNVDVINSIIQNNAYYGLILNQTKNNKLYLDTFLNNPIDLFCNSTSGFRESANFSSTKCQANLYCNFASCSTTNTPFNITGYILSPRITTCGQISNPGTYKLENNLNLQSFSNTLTAGQSNLPCIYITASNVKLDCQGNNIQKAGYGIQAYGGIYSSYNITIQNCDFSNDTDGLYMKNYYQIGVNNIKASNTVAGLSLINVTSSGVSNYYSTGSTYGLYLNTSTEDSFSNITASNNRYGIYVAQGTSNNTYQGGSLGSNQKGDMFCASSTYNGSNIFQGVGCGSTDCNFASSICKVHFLPPVGTYFLGSCSTILAPGSYSLDAGVYSANTCMKIESPNVTFSCNGYGMIGSGGGSGFLINHEKNVSITNCNIAGFTYGISAYNSSSIQASYSYINGSTYGMYLGNIAGSLVFNVTTYKTAANAFIFNNVSRSLISNNIAARSANASGFTFVNSQNNTVIYNTATNNYVDGFLFAKTSQFNNVQNNTGNGNGYDYACTQSNGGIYSEFGEVNSGLTKSGCIWLAEIPILTLQDSCQAINGQVLTSLGADMYYTYGTTCFSFYDRNTSANGDVLNCNGHTILASNGGTFVDVINASRITIKNCYLKGFTTPIIDTNNGLTLLNTEIVNSNVSLLENHAVGTQVSGELFENDSYGVLAENAIGGSFRNSTILNSQQGLYVVGGQGLNVTNDSISTTEAAVTLVNTSYDTFNKNSFVSIETKSLVCSGSANSNNYDTGFNSCTYTGCMWISKSASTCTT